MDRRIIPIAAVILTPATACADQCQWMEQAEGKSEDGRFVVRLDYVNKEWKGRFEDTKTGAVLEAKPEGLSAHAHFSVLVSDDGSRVVIFEPRVDNRRDANLLVYDREFKLLRGFTLQELLTDDDRLAVRRSISHLEFVLTQRGTNQNFRLKDDGKTFEMHLRSGRTVLVSLAEPKIVPATNVEE